MTRKLLWLTLCWLTLFGALLNAQDDGYRLREPSAEDYLMAIPVIVEWAYTQSDSYDLIRLMISQEFNLRYAGIRLSELPFTLLRNFQTSLAIGADSLLFTDEAAWFLALLESGVREAGITDFTSEFTVGNFELIPTPIDLNTGAREAYLLQVNDRSSYREFYALVDQAVRLLPTPIVGLPGNVTTRGDPNFGQLTILQIADLDGDGESEFIFEGGGYGYWESCGDLYVIDMQGDALVDRTGEFFHYCVPSAQMDTAAVEFDITHPESIQMIERRVDGWNCQRTHTDTLNLVEGGLSTSTVYDDTTWCDLRGASEAFVQADYGVASEIYASVLPEFDGQIQMEAYVSARLALSYALNNRLDRAQATLDSAIPVGQMGELLLRLRNVSTQSDEMCRVARQFFSEVNGTQANVYSNPYAWTPQNFHFGREPLDPRSFPLPDPAQAGCDFLQVTGIEATPVPTLDVAIPDVNSLVLWDAYFSLMRGEYQDLLTQIDTIRALPGEVSAPYTRQLSYWRALALELTGRSVEALAEYVAIYAAAPESARGMLAALHMEGA
ncbi:MAG: hypothetical protein KC519_21755 [Anaerolineae bacterium]|nr:hypothetical protein [Anaerolineae bacterium]